MIFNEEKFPILRTRKKVKDNQCILLGLNRIDEYSEFRWRGLNIPKERHKDEDYYVSKAIVTDNLTYISSTILDKCIKLRNENDIYKLSYFLDLKEGDCGVFLFPNNKKYNSQIVNSICYTMINDDIMYINAYNGDSLFSSFRIDRSDKCNSLIMVEHSTPIEVIEQSEELDFLELFMCSLFIIQKSEVEINILDKLNKKKKINKEKYLNKTGIPIKVIDSNWFTTTIQTSGFGVKGHFRLQPCGVNSQDRKLIWVKEFKKNGYTRKAGILN